MNKTISAAQTCVMLFVVFSHAMFAEGAGKPQAAPGRLMRPVIRGRSYAVSSMRPESTQVAERILRAGGNAFDAAVAAQAVLALVDAPNNGVGSDAMLLVYDARASRAYSVNAEGTAPQLATIDWYMTHQQGKIPVSDGLLSGTVPGVVDAWYTLLDRWGTMTFAEVLAPAIEMAANGFVLNERLAESLKSEKLRKYPTSVLAFSLDRSWESGAIYTVPQLARTLGRLVEAEREASAGGRRAALKAARDRFYMGDIAHEMAEFSEQNGGLFRYEDFATYGAMIEEPVSIDYRGYQVLKDRSANQGPAELFALNILETFDLQALQHNSAEYIHAGAESIKLAFADREYLGDDRFIKIPWETLLSKEYAAQRRRLIDPDKACCEFRQGKIESFVHPADIDYVRPDGDGGDTSYLCVIDQDRNVVSFTPSLHTGYGTCVAMGELGFTLNCRGDYFSLVPGHPNALAPGKRPRSTLQSTLVLKDGKPCLVMGSPGGDDQCLRTLQTFLNIVEFGMNVQQAIEAPRWSTRSFPQSYFPHTMYPGEVSVEDRIPEVVREALRKKGHKLNVTGGWSLGSTAAIAVDPATGVLSAGADPRVDACAVAW
ncbi:MAG: gamma-glutamyltransferase [Pirellulaceae bacterium]